MLGQVIQRSAAAAEQRAYAGAFAAVNYSTDTRRNGRRSRYG